MSAGAEVARDEVSELKEALRQGKWRALLAPGAEGLLAQALLADASWWPEAADKCADRINDLTLDDSRSIRFASRELRATSNKWHSQWVDSRGPLAERCTESAQILRGWTRWLLPLLPVARPDLCAALTILERWPPG